MWSTVQTLLIVGAAAVLVLLGYGIGRAGGRKRPPAGRTDFSSPTGPSPTADESYQGAYRAGHLQGWRDASSRQEGSHQPDLAEETVPARLAWTDVPAARTAVNQGSTVAADHPWLPVAGPVRLPAPRAVPVPAGSAVPAPAVSPGPPQPSPAHTKAEGQARRDRRDRQNINVTLYVASLLLVAAGALFIGTNLPAALRFTGVCAITAMFYAAGFILHAKAPRLKPAAVAFAGTGLALIPVTGLAMYNFTLHNGPVAWLVTSLIGTVAYVVAAVRLESRVLVFLSLTFVVSTAWSGVSVLGGALVWYFTAMIGVAVLLTLLALVRPRWLPPVYLKPMMDLHPFVVPTVAVAVTFVPLLLGKGEFALIMAMCGCYFALMAAVPAGKFRLPHFHAARLALTVAAAVAVLDLTGRTSLALLAAALLLALQSMAIAFGTAQLAAWFPAAGDTGRWNADALSTFALQLLATLAFGVATQLDAVFPSEGAFQTLPAAGGVALWVPVLMALLTGMVLAVRIGGAAEWAPAAGLVPAAAFAWPLGAWTMAGMLVLAAAFWAVRAVPAGGPLRRHFVLASRAAATVTVPVLVAAVIGGVPDRTAVAVLSLSLVLASQQLVTAGMLRGGIAALAPRASLAVGAGAGVLSIGALALADHTGGSALTGIAVTAQLVAGLGLGWLLVPHSSTWKATVGEALPIGISLAMVPLAFAAVSLTLGNITLLLVTAYSAAMAARLQGLERRWWYWWLGRAAATALVMTAFHQLQQAVGTVVVGGEEVRPATVLVLVLGLQLVFPLGAAVRGRAARFVMADVSVVLGVQAATAAVATFAGRFGDTPDVAGDWHGTVSAVVMALGAAATGFVLRYRNGSLAFAPAMLAVLLLFRGGELRDVELVVGIFAAFSAVMVVAVQHRTPKGGYFVAARVLTAALAVVLSYDIAASATAVSVTFALVLVAQHMIRWLMRRRLQEVPFQQAAVWITLAGQALLPIAYLSRWGFPERQQLDDGGRWVVLLELVLLLVSAVVASRLFAARGAVYLAVYAALFGVVALGPLFRYGPGEYGSVFLAAPVLNHNAVALVLLGMALAATAFGILLRQRNVAQSDIEHWFWLAAAGAFAVSGAGMSTLASDWISGTAVLMLGAVCFAASHVERLPAFYPPAAASALLGATLTARVLFRDVPGAWGGYLPWLAGCGLAAAGLYAVRLARSGPLLGDAVRRWTLAGAALLGLALAAVAGLRHDATSWTGALLVALTAAVAYLEVPAGIRRVTAELGALAVTAAVQRAVLFVDNGQHYHHGPDPFWTLQWYVVLAAVLALLRFNSGHLLAGRILLGAGAGLLSLGGLGTIFGGNGGQQLWVLALLALLLVAGLVLGDRLFVWWGAAGVALCLMWAIRQYTFALLALIAVGLIAFAVWRLNRSKPEPVPAETRQAAAQEEPFRLP